MPLLKQDLNENIEIAKNLEVKPQSSATYSKNSLCRGIVEIYYDYCANSSIDGMQYLGRNRPLKEKIFWLCIFAISIYCCSCLIHDVYDKWNETPVIVSFSEKTTPVWSIPFPAITICAETKRSLKTEGLTFAKLYAQLRKDMKLGNMFTMQENITINELDEFRTLLHICNTQLIDAPVPAMSTKPINYFDILDKMLPPFERNFFYCKWLRNFIGCDELFTKTYTEDGICYTFNGLNATDIYREHTYQYKFMGLRSTFKPTDILNRTLQWTLEDGYASVSGIKTYPARVLAAGARAGLFIALHNFKQEVDYACRGPVQGFKVLLHAPDDVPHVSKEYVRIPMEKEIQIAVKPNMITTSIGIANYHPLRRQCYMSRERKLQYFKIYTQSNCELECLSNFTLDKCGCVKFSMPRALNTPVCNEENIHCYDSAEDELLLREFNEDLQQSAFNYRGPTKCNCLPSCTSLSYNTEISQGNFDLTEMLEAAGDTAFLDENPGLQMSRLSIYFRENQFITSKRSELYGVTDFLANCGGIFGLFIGFTILSVIELIYHFTLRLWTHMRRMRKM